jgi:hypothetical protein
MEHPIIVKDEAADFSCGAVNRAVGSAKVYVETKVEFQELYSGWVDAFAIRDGVIHVFDLKTGWGSDEDYTAQQEGYALGLLDMAKEGKLPDVTDTENAVMHLIWEDQRRVYTWETTYTVAKALVMEILAKRMTPDIKPRANKNCQWCEKLPNCEAVNHEILALVNSQFPTRFETPEQLSKANVIGGLLKAWADTVQKLCNKHIADGGVLPDYKHSLCKGREIAPSVKDAWAACKDSLEAEHGENAKEVFLTTCSVSAPKLRGLYKGKDFPAESIMGRGTPYYRLTCKRKLLK